MNQLYRIGYGMQLVHCKVDVILLPDLYTTTDGEC